MFRPVMHRLRICINYDYQCLLAVPDFPPCKQNQEQRGPVRYVRDHRLMSIEQHKKLLLLTSLASRMLTVAHLLLHCCSGIYSASTVPYLMRACFMHGAYMSEERDTNISFVFHLVFWTCKIAMVFCPRLSEADK